MTRIFKLIIPITVILSSLLISDFAQAQNRFSISGTLRAAETGEALIGANIQILNTNEGTTTNNYGFYSITPEALDSLGIIFSYLGYESVIKKVYLDGDIQINLELQSVVSALDAVVVKADQNDDNVSRPQMGVVDIPSDKIKELPAILGEPDVLKIVQLLPGVQSGNEGTTGFHVRGGGADQNLVQLDEAVVYNPNHLFGLFSAFNTRAINNVSLIKGGFPAQFGGRLSSILDISMKEGNKKKFGVEGGIGMVSTQVTVEGPIIQDEASFIVSGRRTYFDWLIKPFLPKKIKTNYTFYDFNAKINWRLGPKDHVFASAFRGNDDAFYSQDGIEYNIFFGNETATLRWNHIFGPRLFLNTSLIFNHYDQKVAAIQDNALSRVVSSISDINGKMEFQYYPNTKHKIRFGLHLLDHEFKSTGDTQAQSGFNPGLEIGDGNIPRKDVNEFALYFSDEMVLNETISTSWGIRLPGFVSKDADYYHIEPRVSLKTQLTPHGSVKASYTMMNQFIHLIPSSTAAVPTDIWIPSSRQTRPQRSQQVALGYFQNFYQNEIESSVELYYKTMDNQVLFKEGNQLIQSLDVDNLLVYGKGWSYGAEFFLKKKRGRFTGWAAYTLSWTNQQFDQLNFGRKFPFRYDRRHNLSLVASYNLSKKWLLSSTFVFSSGSTFTVPNGRTHISHGGSLFEGNYFIYEARNNARLHPYHRLNFSVTYRKDRRILGKEYDSELVLSLYNVYSRANPYFVYFQIDPRTDKPTARQVSLLPIIPSLSYNFKF